MITKPSSRCNARQGSLTRRRRGEWNSWVCRRCKPFTKRSARWCKMETKQSTPKKQIIIWWESHWQQPHCRRQSLALCPYFNAGMNKETVLIVAIIDRVGVVTYQIQLIGSSKTLVVHRNRLKLFYCDPQGKASKKQPTPAPQSGEVKQLALTQLLHHPPQCQT